MTECGLLVGAILLILGVALGFTGYLIQAQVPEQLILWVKGSVHSPLLFLLALNFFLLIVGCLMDIFSAIVVVVPLMAMSGLDAQYASMMDAGKYVAPGPNCTIPNVGFPVTRAYASAIAKAERSLRPSTTRTPSRFCMSISGFCGAPVSVNTYSAQ